MDSVGSCSESNHLEADDLISEFHSSFFAKFQSEELFERLDNLCTEAILGLSENPSSDALREWLKEERFTWRILTYLNACWQKKRHMQMYCEDEHSQDNIHNLEMFCNLLEKEALPEVDKVKSRFSHILQQPCDWPETLFTAKKPKFNVKQQTRMDPDAPFQGSSLALRDQMTDEKISQIAFTFLRTGQLEEAVSLYESVNQFWRAAALAGQTVLNEDDFDLWKSTNAKLSSNHQFSLYERAIYGLLAGRVESVWPVCETLDDYWWAAANCSLHKELTPKGANIFDLVNVFDIVRDKAPVEIVQRARMPIRRIQQFLVLGEIQDVIEYCSSLLSDWNESDGFVLELYRFMTHLAIALKRYAPSKFTRQKFERFDRILSAYSTHIAQFKSVCHLAVSYISLITDPIQRIRTLSTVLETASDIEDRLVLVQESVSVLLNDEVYKGISQYLENRRKTFTFEFKIGASELDPDLIREMEMFRCVDNPIEQVLVHGNALCRYCISIEDNDGMNEVVAKVESFTGWHSFEGRALVEEHDDIVEYLTFQGAIRRWFIASGIDEDAKSNCQVAAEEVALSAIRMLSKNWMEPPRQDKEASRVHQMKLIRKVCLPKVLSTTLAVLQRSEKFNFVNDLIRCFSIPNNDLCQLLSSEQIKMTLEAACAAAQDLLCRGTDAFVQMPDETVEI